MAWQRTGVIESSGSYGIVRCEGCLTPSLKMDAVKHYMDRWQREHPSQTTEEGNTNV